MVAILVTFEAHIVLDLFPVIFHSNKIHKVLSKRVPERCTTAIFDRSILFCEHIFFLGGFVDGDGFHTDGHTHIVNDMVIIMNQIKQRQLIIKMDFQLVLH